MKSTAVDYKSIILLIASYIKSVGQLVSDVRFADDQGMVAGTEMGLQRLMNKLNDTAKTLGTKISVQITKQW